MGNRPRKTNENNFMTLLNFIVDPAVIVDEKGHFLVINDAFVDLTGLSKKELIGKVFLELGLLTAESKAILLKNLKKRMQGLPVKPYEINFTDKTGNARYVEVKAKKIDYTGQPADLVIFRDITRRKENARRLKEYSEKMEVLVNEKVKEVKESEERYRELTESISDVFFAMDKDLRYTYWNKASEKLIGISAKDAIGKSLTEIFPDVKGTKVEQFYKEVLRTKQPQSFVNEYRFRDKDFVFEIRAYPTMAGISVFVKDITEQKNSQAKLVASEKKYRKLFENLKLAEKQLLEERDRAQNYLDIAGVMLVALDTKGRVTLLNRKGCAILRCTAEEALGQNWFENFLPKDTRNKVKKIFQASIKRKKCLLDYNENYVASKSGEPRLIAWHNVLLKNSRGQIIGTLSSGEDITEKKKMEAEIQSVAKFPAENPNPILRLNKEGILLYANEASRALLQHIKCNVNKTAPRFLRDLVTEVLTTRLNKNVEVTLGRKTWSFLVAYIKGHDYANIYARDITEQKQAQQALADSEEKFRAISTYASDAVILLDKRDGVVFWNLVAEKIFGYTKEETIGKKLARLVVQPKFRSAHLELLTKVLEQRGQVSEKRFEVTAIRKDGTEFPIELTVSALKLKDAPCMLEIIRDVSERKKMEDAVKQERDMLEAVTENIGAGLTIISKDYRILWVNKLLRQINGDCEGKVCYSTFNTLDCICSDCGVKKVFENSVPIDTHEYFTKDEKGNTVWVELIVTPIKDKKGKVIAALELAVNITERKLLQNKLEEYSQQLEKLVAKRTEELKKTQAKLVTSERLATIGELAAMVGHDLRNPLTGMMGAAYYLKTKHCTEVGAKGKEMLETIEKAINHSNKIINDLLEYSRDLKLELTETNPKAMLQNALSSLEIPEKIQMINATEKEPTVKADTEKIHRVFVSIIQNAIDAMPEGGTLTIKSRKVKGKCEIAFKDSGAGMSEETLSKLKGGVPLFTTKAKGMGFGLPICKRIVDAHGGKLSVESKIGKGSKVTVTIPVNPKPANEGEEKWIFSESMLSATLTAQGSTVNAKG